jgi:very-short-patch-repair endonuclease
VTGERRRRTGERARTLRKEPTPSEALLWKALRDRQLDGRKFRRQQPIGPFIVDFFCPERQLVVEVDGSVHEMQYEADQERQQLIEQAGYRVLRLASDLVERDLPATLAQIRAALRAEAPSPPSPLSLTERDITLPLRSVRRSGLRSLSRWLHADRIWTRSVATVASATERKIANMLSIGNTQGVFRCRARPNRVPPFTQGGATSSSQASPQPAAIYPPSPAQGEGAGG